MTQKNGTVLVRCYPNTNAVMPLTPREAKLHHWSAFHLQITLPSFQVEQSCNLEIAKGQTTFMYECNFLRI